MFASSSKHVFSSRSSVAYVSKASRSNYSVRVVQLRQLSTLPPSREPPHGSQSSTTPPTDATPKHPSPPIDHSTSSKLFADAALEESSPISSPKRPGGPIRGAFAGPDEPWTGDERPQDAVLRMLVDKYKPLRGEFMSADQRLKKAPPSVRSAAPLLEDEVKVLDESASFSQHLANTKTIKSESPVAAGSVSSNPPAPNGALANVPLLPSNPDHRPWHTTYVAPTHSHSSVKLGRISSSPSSSSRSSDMSRDPDDPSKRKDVQKMRRRMNAVRLTSAKESTLDYKLGLRKSAGLSGLGGDRISLKQWDSIIEEKIEKAVRDGKFAHVPGRGAPIARSADEGNPFIAREEFLLNRMVQRQGAAPPWVELQRELESALSSFRTTLRTSWVRQAVRLITRDTPTALLPTVIARLSIADAAGLRDPSWVQREAGYHARAIGEVNDLLRRYNGLAPPSVRRGYCSVDVELGRVYEDSAVEVLDRLKAEVGGVMGAPIDAAREDEEEDRVKAWDGIDVSLPKLGDLWRSWVGRLFNRR